MTDEYTPDDSSQERSGYDDPGYDPGRQEDTSAATGASNEPEQRAGEREVPGTESAREGWSDGRGTAAGEPLEGAGQQEFDQGGGPGQGDGGGTGQGVGEDDATGEDF